MSRLKAAQAKTSASTLTMIATKMDIQPWWKQTLYEFAREMPAKEQWQEKLATDKSGVEYLHGIIKDLHLVMEGFRPRSIEEGLQHLQTIVH